MRSATEQSHKLSTEAQPVDASTQQQLEPAQMLTQASAIPTKLKPQIRASLEPQIQIDSQQQGLQLLSQHPSLYQGHLATAAATITRTAADLLEADRVTFWRYNLAERRFDLVDGYSRILAGHFGQGSLPVDSYAAYFDTLGTRPDIALDNVRETAELPWIGCLVQDDVIFHAPGAFLEMPIRCQGQVVGAIWYERTSAYHWTDLAKSTALSIALLAATVIDTQQQQVLSVSLANYTRQLKRETIEREQADLAWQESQRFIQGIIDASTNILYVDSFADGSNFYISRWIKNVLGYEPYEVQKLGPQYLEQLVHADEKKHMAAERAKLAAINDGEVVENEYRFRHRQGNWRWLLCRETVFQRDREGQPTQVFGTATDITKRKHAEVALHEFNRELERLANMDGLTKVANRRSFDKYLEQEWKNVGSGRSSLSLILCDIDYFKNYNDTYGHQAGDLCLMQVAQAIERAVKRSSDQVSRYGGEEFAVVLPNTSLAGVEQVAIEIQREIQQLNIPHSRSEVSECITLSLGISAVSCTQNKHAAMLVAAADQGLYQAKYEGRNRFCLAEIDADYSERA